MVFFYFILGGGVGLGVGGDQFRGWVLVLGGWRILMVGVGVVGIGEREFCSN